MRAERRKKRWENSGKNGGVEEAVKVNFRVALKRRDHSKARKLERPSLKAHRSAGRDYPPGHSPPHLYKNVAPLPGQHWKTPHVEARKKISRAQRLGPFRMCIYTL